MVRQFSTFGLAENGLSINLFRTSLSKRKKIHRLFALFYREDNIFYFTEYCKPEDTFQKTFFFLGVCMLVFNQSKLFVALLGVLL